MEEMIDLDEIQAGASLEAWESIDDTLDGLERHFRVTNALFLEKMAKIREEMRLFRPVSGEN
jgi:hypothetical protein